MSACCFHVDIFSKRAYAAFCRICKTWKSEEDNADSRRERLFTAMQQVSTWITMAYPTWLVFFKNKTEIADFLFKIYIPFDCKFMVARTNVSDSGQEIITEVYQIDRRKELRSHPFGVWDVKKGLKGPAQRGLYLRRNDLYGQNIRVTSVHVRLLVLFISRSSSAINYSLIEEDNSIILHST